jgi:ribonuclease HI
MTAEQAVYYVRAVVFPALLYRLLLGDADQRCIARLQSICDRAVRNRAWLPQSICVEAIRLPIQFGGLGLGSLAAEVDGAIVQLVRTVLQRPDLVPAKLLCAALEHWRDAYALPSQPLEQLRRLPFAVSGHVYSTRSFVHAVAGALDRSGLAGLRVAVVPDRRLPADKVREGGAIAGTALCDVLPPNAWRQLHKDCAQHGLFAVEQLASADGLRFAYFRDAGIRFKGRGEPVFWQRLRERLADERGYLRTAVGPCVAADAAQPVVPPAVASALDVYAAATRGAAPLPPAVSSIVYTDGSATHGDAQLRQAGSAAVAYALGECGPVLCAEAQVRVAGHQTSYKAELLAILQAMRSAADVRQVVVRTDSMAAIAALRSALSEVPSVRKSASCKLRTPCIEIVQEIAAAWRRRGLHGQSTRIAHVRAHRGEPGNEHADRVAAAARTLRPERRAGLQFCGGINTVCVAAGGCRLEGDVRQYVRQRAVLALLEQRNTHREQGVAFHALTQPHVMSAAEPWADLEMQLLRFPVLPPTARPTSSADWRSWGRRMHAVAHQAMPTRKWLWHRKRAAAAACDRADHDTDVVDTCAHAVRECSSSAETRAAYNDALLALLSSEDAIKLRRDFAQLRIDQVLALPVPVALIAGETRAALQRWEPWKRARAVRLFAELSVIQREFALSVWRRLRAGAGTVAGADAAVV